MRKTDDEYQALVCKTISNKAKSVACTSYSSFVTEPPGTVLSAVRDRDDARGMYQLFLDHLHKKCNRMDIEELNYQEGDTTKYYVNTGFETSMRRSQEAYHQTLDVIETQYPHPHNILKM